MFKSESGSRIREHVPPTIARLKRAYCFACCCCNRIVSLFQTFTRFKLDGAIALDRSRFSDSKTVNTFLTL